MMRGECESCAVNRDLRARVLTTAREADPTLHQPPFDIAPALYARNVPRYYTILLRARQYAQTNNLVLHWNMARDVPLHRDDRDLPKDQLDQKRKRWLTFHDQQTAHIASQTPLAINLPVRLTDSVDRRRGLFRGRRGRIVGWAPHPEEAPIIVDGERLLTKMTRVIYVYFPNAKWTIHKDLGEGVYPLTPVSRSWKLNRTSQTKVRRTGFFLIPDFASTAHMIQGQSLAAAFADLVNNHFFELPTEEVQVSGYVMLSRAKILAQLWLRRPFAKEIFTGGPPMGPNILMQKLDGDLSESKVQTMFKENDEKGKKKGGNGGSHEEVVSLHAMLFTWS